MCCNDILSESPMARGPLKWKTIHDKQLDGLRERLKKLRVEQRIAEAEVRARDVEIARLARMASTWDLVQEAGQIGVMLEGLSENRGGISLEEARERTGEELSRSSKQLRTPKVAAEDPDAPALGVAYRRLEDMGLGGE